MMHVKSRERLAESCATFLTSIGLGPFFQLDDEHLLQPQVVLPRVVDAAREPHPEVARVAGLGGWIQ